MDALMAWAPRIGQMATKAATIKQNGEVIELTLRDMKKDVEERLKEALKLLRVEKSP
jgi:hypothetical protein